jgi:hypothetical protein
MKLQQFDLGSSGQLQNLHCERLEDSCKEHRSTWTDAVADAPFKQKTMELVVNVARNNKKTRTSPGQIILAMENGQQLHQGSPYIIIAASVLSCPDDAPPSLGTSVYNRVSWRCSVTTSVQRLQSSLRTEQSDSHLEQNRAMGVQGSSASPESGQSVTI